MDEKSSSWLALPREAQRLTTAWLRHGAFGFPSKVLKSAVTDPQLDSVTDEARILELVGESILEFFDSAGPIYGKAAQIALTRLGPSMQRIARSLHLNRLYGDWPPMEFNAVCEILDSEIPRWRDEFDIEARPIGVASVGQVHGAVDRQGKRWVIKIIKPRSRKRLFESLGAFDQVVATIQPLAITHSARRMVREMRELSAGLKREMNLEHELDTIERVRGRLKAGVLRIPQVRRDFSTKSVLTLERFDGVSLSKVVDGSASLTASQRRKLARKMLQELLVQVFEVGLFHADPHAGNLILLDDGSVGLFDWGLAGELLESDRKHIAAMLKAVLARDMERLVDVLQAMAEDSSRKVKRTKIKRELRRLEKMVKDGIEDPKKKPSLQQLVESSLKAASRLGIPVPGGLMLMAKSLITVEGLAKGIDPNVSMKLVAAPVLFRAARPTFKDFLAISRKFPDMARRTFFS